MAGTPNGTIRATVDPAGQSLEARVDLAAPPERVFQALASNEITEWWVRPGVFDTREWTGDPRPTGRWRISGMSRGQPYVAQGEFLEVAAPTTLVHSWDGVGAPGAQSTLTYQLEPQGNGTRLTLRQTGFASPIACREFATGWETSFERLAQILGMQTPGARE